MDIRYKTKRTLKAGIKEMIIDKDKYLLEPIYKSPLALFLLGEHEFADEVFKYINSNPNFLYYSDEYVNKRKAGNYYNFWLYLYGYYSENEKLKKDSISKMVEQANVDKGIVKATNDSETYELRSTAFTGICLYLNNNINEATQISKSLISLFIKNEYESKMFLQFTAEGELCKNFNDVDEKYFIIECHESKPMYYALTLSIINLLIGYKYTNNNEFLVYAEKYYEKLLTYGDDAIFNNYIAKLYISVELLKEITNKERYIEMSKRLNEYFDYTICNDGLWESTEKDKILSYDRTSEYIASQLMIAKLKENSKYDLRRNKRSIIQ